MKTINAVTYLEKYNNIHWNRYEREYHYQICRALGFSYGNSARMRDWTLAHITQCHNAVHRPIIEVHDEKEIIR